MCRRLPNVFRIEMFADFLHCSLLKLEGTAFWEKEMTEIRPNAVEIALLLLLESRVSKVKECRDFLEVRRL
jgi:hypothetical protein